MPHLVQKTLIMNGVSHATLLVFIQSDGQSGELSNYVLLDPATELLNTIDTDLPMGRRQDLILKRVWYEMVGVSITLLFNSTTPWPFWILTPGTSTSHDWRFFGGVPDDSDHEGMGLDSDGKLLITTTNLRASNSTASFVLWVEKRNRLLS